jgi:hypothetical protein
MIHLPHLSKAQATGLALWSLGMVLARSCALTAVSTFLAEGLRQQDNTVRQRLRAWCYESQAKRGKKRQEVHVETCFAPVLAWVLRWWTGTQLALALDATTLGDRCVVLAISVVYRGCAIPVAWVVLEAGKKQAWRREWLRMLRKLKHRGPTGLDGERVGGSGLVCALVIPASRALGMASVFAHQQRRDVSVRGLTSVLSPDELGAGGGHAVERSRYGLQGAGAATGVHPVGALGYRS